VADRGGRPSSTTSVPELAGRTVSGRSLMSQEHRDSLYVTRSVEGNDGRSSLTEDGPCPVAIPGPSWRLHPVNHFDHT